MALASTPVVTKTSSKKDYERAGVQKATTPTAPSITGGGSSKGKTTGVIVVRTDSPISDLKSGQQLTTGQGIVNIDGGSKAGGQSIQIKAEQGQEFSALSNQIQQSQTQAAAQQRAKQQQEQNYIDFQYGRGDSPSMTSDAGRLYVSEGFKKKVEQAQQEEAFKQQQSNPTNVSYNEKQQRIQREREVAKNKKSTFTSMFDNTKIEKPIKTIQDKTNNLLAENKISTAIFKGAEKIEVKLTPYEESIGRGNNSFTGALISKSIYKTTNLVFNTPSFIVKLAGVGALGVESLPKLKKVIENPENYREAVNTLAVTTGVLLATKSKRVSQNLVTNPTFYVPEYTSTVVSYLAAGKVLARLTELRPFGSVVTTKQVPTPKLSLNVNEVIVPKTNTVYGVANGKNVPMYDLTTGKSPVVETYPTISPVAKVTKVDVTKALIKEPVQRVIQVNNGKAELVIKIPSKTETKYYVRLPKVKGVLVVEGQTLQKVVTPENVLFTQIQKKAKFSIEIPKEARTPQQIKLKPLEYKGEAFVTQEVEVLKNIPITKIIKEPQITYRLKDSIIQASGRTPRVYDLFDGAVLPETLKGFKIQKASQGLIKEAYVVTEKTSNKFVTKGLAMNIPIIENQLTTKTIVQGGKVVYNPTLKLEIEKVPSFIIVPNITVNRRTESIVKEIQQTKYNLGQLPTQELKPRIEARIKSDSALKQQPSLRQQPALRQEAAVRQDIALKQNLALKQQPIIKQVRQPIQIPIRVPLIRLPETQRQKQLVKGFDVVFLEKGKVVKGNIKPLGYDEAFKFGKDIAENSISASFKLVETGTLVPKGTRQNFARGSIVDKFNFVAGRSRKTQGFFVEKSQFRINTEGEKKGLSVARAVKNYRQSVFKPKKLFSI